MVLTNLPDAKLQLAGGETLPQLLNLNSRLFIVQGPSRSAGN